MGIFWKPAEMSFQTVKRDNNGCCVRSDRKVKPGNKGGGCTSPLAVKSFLYSLSFSLFLALNGSDNRQSSFSYVEVSQRSPDDNCKSVSDSFPLRSVSVIPSSCLEVIRGESWGKAGSKIWRGSDPVLCSAPDQCASVRRRFKTPAKRLSHSARWAHPFVCYLNPGFGEIQSWLNNKSIWEDKEHLGNGFSLPV